MIDTNDFFWAQNGKNLGGLQSQDAHLLAGIERKVDGNERALLLLHGFSSSPAVWRMLLPGLDMYNAVVCPALPGHCENLTAFSKVKAEQWVASTEHICQELLKTYKHVDVMGLSLGGILALGLVHKYPLHHAYLLAPALALPFNITVVVSLLIFLKKLGIKAIKTRAGNLHRLENAELVYKKHPITVMIELLKFINRVGETSPKCPVDVFLGWHDPVINNKKVFQMVSKWPNTTTHWLPHSSHVLPLDGDQAIILNCLRNHWPTGHETA